MINGVIKMTNKEIIQEIIQEISYMDIAVAVEELGELIKPLQKLARLKLNDKTLRVTDQEIIKNIKEEIVDVKIALYVIIDNVYQNDLEYYQNITKKLIRKEKLLNK